MDTRIVLGLPAVGTDPSRPFWAPLARAGEFRQLHDELTSRPDFLAEFWAEYVSIFVALQDMGVDFVVLGGAALDAHPQFRKVAEMMTANGCEFVEPVPGLERMDFSRFPRDLSVMLASGACLIDTEVWEKARLSPSSRMIKSVFGCGGRVQHRQDVALVSDLIVADNPLREYGLLHELGLRVGRLPHTLLTQTERSLVDNSVESGISFDDHVDRSTGLLEDAKGALHLVVDPMAWTGYRGPEARPATTVAKTRRRFRRVCEELEIELHVPSHLSVPVSVGFHQFADGRVLMSGGEDELAGLVTDIVGSDNVFVTEVPLLRFPLCARAGLRCLIGEIPTALIRN